MKHREEPAMNNTTDEHRAVVFSGLIRPWVGMLHHSRELCDDWGFIRDEAGKLIITVPVTVPHEEWAWHRRNNTDPTQQTVDAILDALNRPNGMDEGPRGSASESTTKPL